MQQASGIDALKVGGGLEIGQRVGGGEVVEGQAEEETKFQETRLQGRFTDQEPKQMNTALASSPES